MTEQWIELGRRAVACKGWRWMPGLLDHDGWRLVGHDGRVWAAAAICPDDNEWKVYELDSGGIAYPDFRDPATLGCLLALVREAWDMDALVTHQDDGGLWGAGSWVHEDYVGWHFAAIVLPACLTEAEALVCALEAAP